MTAKHLYCESARRRLIPMNWTHCVAFSRYTLQYPHNPQNDDAIRTIVFN